MLTRRRHRFLGIDFDMMTMGEVLDWLRHRRVNDTFAFVVTPNVDHAVRLHSANVEAVSLEKAYREAALCLCDSRILSRLAKWRGVELAVVPGSDLTAVQFETAGSASNEKFAVVGGNPRLRETLQSRFPSIEIVQHVPPMGLASNQGAIDAAARFVIDSGARLSFLAVGSPQQELVAMRIAQMPEARGTALCIGASLEFLSGDQHRAPAWMRKAGLEWLFRLLSEPRRMWRRYLVEGPKIFRLAWQWPGPKAPEG
jgi:exopolysaccharide biosynthesis WecB/TagA/CpsF family protein